MDFDAKNEAFQRAWEAHLATLPAGTALTGLRAAFTRGWQAAADAAYGACRDNREGGLVIVGTTIDEGMRSVVSRECAALVAIRTEL